MHTGLRGLPNLGPPHNAVLGAVNEEPRAGASQWRGFGPHPTETFRGRKFKCLEGGGYVCVWGQFLPCDSSTVPAAQGRRRAPAPLLLQAPPPTPAHPVLRTAHLVATQPSKFCPWFGAPVAGPRCSMSHRAVSEELPEAVGSPQSRSPRPSVGAAPSFSLPGLASPPRGA